MLERGRTRPTARRWTGSRPTPGTMFVYSADEPEACLLATREAVVTVVSRGLCAASRRQRVVWADTPARRRRSHLQTSTLQGGMIAPDTRCDREALAILDSCLEGPPDTELIPLLALSVLASRRPFSATRVGARALAMADEFARADNHAAAQGLLDQCARGLERCGALEPAADLREAQAMLRFAHRKGI